MSVCLSWVVNVYEDWISSFRPVPAHLLGRLERQLVSAWEDCRESVCHSSGHRSRSIPWRRRKNVFLSSFSRGEFNREESGEIQANLPAFQGRFSTVDCGKNRAFFLLSEQLIRPGQPTGWTKSSQPLAVHGLRRKRQHAAWSVGILVSVRISAETFQIKFDLESENRTQCRGQRVRCLCWFAFACSFSFSSVYPFAYSMWMGACLPGCVGVAVRGRVTECLCVQSVREGLSDSISVEMFAEKLFYGASWLSCWHRGRLQGRCGLPEIEKRKIAREDARVGQVFLARQT